MAKSFEQDSKRHFSSSFEKFAQEQRENTIITRDHDKADIGDLDKSLVHNLGRMNYVNLLPIQGYSTSVLLSGNDVIVYAPTGSGKTAAFLIPAIELVIRHHKKMNINENPLVLILGNTTNLMLQTYKFACDMAGYNPFTGESNTHVRIFDLFGGGGLQRLRSIKKIRHEIVIATCGGVLEAFKKEKLALSDLRMLIIDEADKMVDENRGFGYEVAQIFSHVPANAIVAEFSATFRERNNQIVLSALEEKLFRAKIPIFIYVTPPKGYITQRVLQKATPSGVCSDAFQKNLEWLVRLIETDLDLHQMEKGGPYNKSTVIFVERRITSNYIALFLQQVGYDFMPLNSDYAAGDIERILTDMSRGKIQGVVATNKIARGQDFSEVDHVIIYEMAQDFNDYKHRIGRTGRMGRGGRATVMICTKKDYGHIVPLVEFFIYHNQDIPQWLWNLYQEIKKSGRMGINLSDSFYSAATEITEDEDDVHEDYRRSSPSSI